MPELNLSFHTSFSLKKEEILQIIKVAEEEEKGTKDSKKNLMAKTGLGNKKVSPVKTWSIRSGLVDRETGKLTPQGAIARKHDPYLQSPVTDWLMHFQLSLSEEGLKEKDKPQTPDERAIPANFGGWQWFIFTFLPNHQNFSRNTLDHAANQIYETDNKKAKSISDDLLKVLKAYTDKKDTLAQISFLKSSAKDQYIAGEATLPPDELIAYFLAKICERDFQSLSQINSDRLLQHPYGLAPILGISTDKVQDLLDHLSGKGIIEQYKTVPPFQIIPRWNEPLDLLEKAYVNN